MILIEVSKFQHGLTCQPSAVKLDLVTLSVFAGEKSDHEFIGPARAAGRWTLETVLRLCCDCVVSLIRFDSLFP